MNYELSFIIPVFNKEVSQFNNCIKSILRIKNKKFEIIIIDDGSTLRKSREYKKIIKHIPNIKYYYKTNGGVSSARNMGIMKATGKYIFFVDADDQLIVDSLNKINLKDENSQLVIFNVEKVHYNKKYIISLKKNSGNVSLAFVLKKLLNDGLLNWVYAKLYLREWLLTNNITFDTSMKLGEDLDFVYKSLINAQQIKYINMAVYKYFFDTSTGIERSINFPIRILKDTYLVYKLRTSILDKIEISEKNKQEYENILKERAINGFFEVYKNLIILDMWNYKKLSINFNNYISLLNLNNKLSFMSKLKVIILRHNRNNVCKMLIKFVYTK